MRLVTHRDPLAPARTSSTRTGSAAARLLASGELGAHLLQLAEVAAAQHLAHEAQDEPGSQGLGEGGEAFAVGSQPDCGEGER